MISDTITIGVPYDIDPSDEEFRTARRVVDIRDLDPRDGEGNEEVNVIVEVEGRATRAGKIGDRRAFRRSPAGDRIRGSIIIHNIWRDISDQHIVGIIDGYVDDFALVQISRAEGDAGILFRHEVDHQRSAAIDVEAVYGVRDRSERNIVTAIGRVGNDAAGRLGIGDRRCADGNRASPTGRRGGRDVGMGDRTFVYIQYAVIVGVDVVLVRDTITIGVFLPIAYLAGVACLVGEVGGGRIHTAIGIGIAGSNIGIDTIGADGPG